MAEQIEEIYSNKEEEGLYTNNVEKINLVGTAEYVVKVDRKQLNSDSVHSTCTRLRLGIQSTQSRLKVIVFTNNKRGQAGKLIGDEKFMAYLANTLVVLNDNGLLFKNNIEYV